MTGVLEWEFCPCSSQPQPCLGLHSAAVTKSPQLLTLQGKEVYSACSSEYQEQWHWLLFSFCSFLGYTVALCRQPEREGEMAQETGSQRGSGTRPVAFLKTCFASDLTSSSLQAPPLKGPGPLITAHWGWASRA